MHEYEITKNILEIAIESAEKAGAVRITMIRLVAGGFSSVMEEPVRMYLDILSKGTMAENAGLVFKKLPVKFKCRECGCTYEKPAAGYDCPACKVPGVLAEVAADSPDGRDIFIESIEVE